MKGGYRRLRTFTTLENSLEVLDNKSFKPEQSSAVLRKQ